MQLTTGHGVCRYPQSFRTAIFLKLKKMCLRGLVVEDPEVRQKFRTLFSSVGSSTFSMLTFVIEFEGWEKLCGSFWLQQGLDLILGFAQDASARNASIDIQVCSLNHLSSGCFAKFR